LIGEDPSHCNASWDLAIWLGTIDFDCQTALKAGLQAEVWAFACRDGGSGRGIPLILHSSRWRASPSSTGFSNFTPSLQKTGHITFLRALPGRITEAGAVCTHVLTRRWIAKRILPNDADRAAESVKKSGVKLIPARILLQDGPARRLRPSQALRMGQHGYCHHNICRAPGFPPAPPAPARDRRGSPLGPRPSHCITQSSRTLHRPSPFRVMKISALTVEPLLYYALDLLVWIGNIHIALCWLISCNISVLRSFQASAKHIWSRSCWREIRFSNRLIKGFSVLGRNGYLNVGVLALANRNAKFLGHRVYKAGRGASKFKRYLWTLLVCSSVRTGSRRRRGRIPSSSNTSAICADHPAIKTKATFRSLAVVSLLRLRSLACRSISQKGCLRPHRFYRSFCP